MKRDQFTFYRSYYEALKALPKRDQTSVLMSVIGYALDEEIPKLSGVPLSVFTLIRPTLDSGRNKARSRMKKGGTSEEQIGTNEKQNGTNEKQNGTNVEQSINEGEIEKEREEEGENDSSLPPTPLSRGKSKRFSPPSVEEVRAYCQERGNGIDPEAFVDFYAARGWKYGAGRPIVDWKAAVRTWEARRRAEQPATTETYRPRAYHLERDEDGQEVVVYDD
jgi:hypothetical protein